MALGPDKLPNRAILSLENKIKKYVCKTLAVALAVTNPGAPLASGSSMVSPGTELLHFFDILSIITLIFKILYFNVVCFKLSFQNMAYP